jgi:Flp pilus assembly protein TadD
MERKGGRAAAAIACLLWLGGCESRPGDLFRSRTDVAQEVPSSGTSKPASTGSHGPASDAAPEGRLGTDPDDDLSLGKKHFRAAEFDVAERHFRRAVASHPLDLESWIGLAACYDRLRRFDLADRAYDEAQKIAGRRAEILNNRGYSHILRGDYPRARELLRQAQAEDPASPYVRNNLELLEASLRTGKVVR